jgi:hypothetical protein
MRDLNPRGFKHLTRFPISLARFQRDPTLLSVAGQESAGMTGAGLNGGELSAKLSPVAGGVV